MAEPILCDDLILEIISCFPLKVAIQCKSLSKNFNRLISEPKFAYDIALRSKTRIDTLFHHSSSKANCFRKIHLHPNSDAMKNHSNNDSNSGISINRSLSPPAVSVSCSGLMLLNFRDYYYYYYCVFNPVLGSYRFIPTPCRGSNFPASIGLAHELKTSLHSHYKLVAVGGRKLLDGTSSCYKFKVFESDTLTWRDSIANFNCNSASIPIVKGCQGVYFRGSLHWLKADGDVLAFDVDKEIARIIRTPPNVISSLDFGNLDGTVFYADSWFGVAQDSLAQVIAFKETIGVYVYDDVKRKWNKKRSFANVKKPRDTVNYRNGFPVFYDGKRLVFRGADENRDLYALGLLSNSWKKIGVVANWANCIQSFVSFVPTLANIPNCSYLHDHDLPDERCRKFLPDLSRLRSLFLS